VRLIAPAIALNPSSEGLMPNSTEATRLSRVEVPATQNSPLGVSETTLVKLTEYGGFVASILALCLLFWVLTQFVKQVKDD
jgi:hypothetical protein